MLLYRYTSLSSGGGLNKKEWAREVIVERKLYMPTYDELDDPLEMSCERITSLDPRHWMAYAESKSKEYGSNLIVQFQKEINEDFGSFWIKREKALRDTIERHRKSTRILSFSALCKDIIMWSWYADKHRGICYEFDFQSKWMEENGHMRYTYPLPKIDQLFDSYKVQFEKLLFHKTLPWEFQKEYRFVQHDNQLGTHYFSLDIFKTPIKSIIFGLRVSENDEKYIRSLVKEANLSLTYKRCKIVPPGKIEIIDAEQG